MSRSILAGWLVIAAMMAMAAPAVADEEVNDAGRVVAVTVFQGQALVTREVELPAGEGLVEVIVTDLPERLLPGSLYAEPGDGVEVRSVRARVRPTDEAPREEIQQLEAQILELARVQRALTREQQLLKQRTNYLDNLGGFTTDGAKEELEHGVLNAETLSELTELVFTKRSEVADRELDVAVELEDVKKRQSLLQRELQTLTAGRQRSRREAVVFLSKGAGEGAVRLNYLVAGATWSPSYNVRASEEDDEVTVEYNASVTQMSGEDWTEVAMTLSTATPSLVAAAPKLEPLAIRLTAPKPASSSGRQSKMELSRQQRQLASNRGNFGVNAPAEMSEELFAAGRRGRPRGGIGGGGGGLGGGGGFGAYYGEADGAIGDSDNDSGLNRIADQLQILDFVSRGELSKEAKGASPADTEGMSVVYRLPNATSLPSRSDKQLIQIAALPLRAERYRVATPVLTSYVYREAKLTNDSAFVLLAGPAATFLGDRFVGRGSAPTVAIGESFTVGLGIDESLRASRELVDKSDRIQGGNRIASFDYELVVENFAGEAAEVRVLDRLPKSDGKAIKVSLVESNPEPTESDDAEEGLLRWDAETPAGGEAKIAYTMTIEHDKNLTIAGAK
ncbi:hypothetical protein MalM25_31570 [Planctomycetes bacterium MalM25]|nr:hypothetical protein MalM25_31570 [Planctomycetes bacterium MalM25]